MDNKSEINEEISLKEIIKTIRELYFYFLSQWKNILLAGVIGGVLGLTYSFINKPVYTATLTFALEEDKSSRGELGRALGLVSPFGFDLESDGGSMFSGSNLTALFKSRTMVEKTLLTPVTVNGKVISLAEMYIQNAKWREVWDKDSKFKNIQFLPSQERKYFTRMHDSIFGVIYKNLSGTLAVGQKDKKIDIISMDVSSNDELFAKYFCEALARQVGQFYVATKTKKARANMAILQKQTDSIRAELNGAITGVAVANDNTFNLNPALNVRRSPSARRQVDVQANTAILTELVKQTELAKVALRKETPLIQVIDRPILPLPKERFGKAKGIVMGGFLAGFLVVLGLIVKRIFREIQN